MKRKCAKKVAVAKEEIAEDWCFVCKDGGEMRICDYKGCLKSYHPCCVQKENSFLESESRWNCSWHTCCVCSKAANRHCYTCVYALCGHCVDAENFVPVKGKSGFCLFCLSVAFLIEENKEYDSEGAKVDFTDLNTAEALFKEYYLIIKEEQGIELKDLYAAKDQLKMKKDIQSSSEEFDQYEESDEQFSDYDDMENGKKLQRTLKGKRSKKPISAARSTKKSNRMKFIGWGSKALIEFLDSIGKKSSERLSPSEVSNIIHGYIRENKLLYRKTITCDAKLQSLFNKKIVSRVKVSDLLEAHFAENISESEDEELDDDSENDNPGSSVKAKIKEMHRDTEKKTKEKGKKVDVPQSRFAAVVDENVKLVYLKKSLLYELIKQPDSFEEKVIGSYVRVKADKHDYYARSTHQLVKVTGVKGISVENKEDTVLLFSGIPKESSLSQLSDDRFSEEECEELKRKVQAGHLERPTMVELQRKATLLHKDITQHWIIKELALLQKLIDRANEKGWRRELFVHLDQKKVLESQQGQEKLLNSVPTVIPDLSEVESNCEDTKHEMEIDEESPNSTPQCDSSVPSDEFQEKAKSVEKTHHNISSPLKMTTSKPIFEPEFKKGPAKCTSGQKTNKPESPKNTEPSKVEVIEILSDDDSFKEDNNNNNNNPILLTPERFGNPEMTKWCILGPKGEREKCLLSVLKSWSKESKYASMFKAWKEGESEDKAIWLLDAIKLIP